MWSALSLQSWAQGRTLKPGEAASVAGTIVSEDELKREISSDLFRLEIQKLQAEANYERGKHQIRENALKRIVDDRLLDAEAAKLKITRVELIAREIDQKALPVSESDVDSFFEANKARINRPKEQVVPQIRQYLTQQNHAKARETFLSRLRSDYNVEMPVEPFRLKVDADTHPSRGPADAPVTLVEFSDFECGFCRDYAAVLSGLVKDLGKDVRLVFRQFPLADIHPNARKAAEASLCAAEQGKFWELHDKLFEDTSRLAIPDLKAKAAAIGLDGAAFNTCLDSGRHADRVTRDVLDGARAGVTGTPALFINGRPFPGVQPAAELTKAINEELKLKLNSKAPQK
jgi:protein-disulfide isomerase/stalled ribosome alternative rescue factor ArfA